MKRPLGLAGVLTLGITACQDTPAPLAPHTEPQLATAAAQASNAAVIEHHYIVQFRDDVPDAPGLARRLTAAHGTAPRFVYTSAVKGFAAELPDAAVAALSRNPNVLRIEPDQVALAFGTQSNATWGLDRIDQRAFPLSGTYSYNYTGAGVTAYIIDTGIRLTHNEFGARAVSGYDAIDGGSADDCNGHGTHVAGTVGGATYGVAKGVALVAVRVLDCNGSGSYAGVIAGVDWVTANHVKPAVANMSLGGGASDMLDEAVQNSIAAGVTYAIAAGNGDRIGRAQNACNYSPARVPDAMTIGATDNTDRKASWSNYGSCVDWFAPGVGITSAWDDSDTQTNTISGTSMATPHAAGVAALYLEHYPTSTALQVRDALYAMTTKSVVTSSNTTNNHLLYSVEGGSGTTNSTPTSLFVPSCTELSCSFTDRSTDSDGTVAAWSWTFGDGATSTAQHPSHTYAAGAAYTVRLTVTDDQGATGTSSQTVTVSSSTSGGMTLSASGYKVRGQQKADLTWSGAAGASVDIWRSGVKVTTTANDGFHTDNINRNGNGNYTYKVCEAGTATCSNEVTVTFN
jgi:subtilisin family serine protease